jgi:ABC-type uncharacterized transport system auxiliary subunit
MSLRDRVHLAVLAAVGLLTTACVSVEIGKDTQQQAQFRIIDGSTAPSAAAVRSNGRALIVSPQPAASVDDSFALTYSRSPNQRAAYQFATWSDRPSNRLAQLLVDRLAARRRRSVALAGRWPPTCCSISGQRLLPRCGGDAGTTRVKSPPN